jgi:glycyl-tRNA synthetase beta chain
MVDAVLAADTDDVYDVWLRAKALAEGGATEAMQRAVQALTRAGNLAKNAAGDAIDPALFASDGEKALYAALQDARTKIAALSVAAITPGC